MSKYFTNFAQACLWSEGMLIGEGHEVDAGKWQGIQTHGHPSLITKEVLNLDWQVPLWRGHLDNGELLDILEEEIKPNRLWADEHFDERVGGAPYNPDPSHVRWPWWRGQDDTTKEDGKFTHTYSERFWPKWSADRPLAHPTPGRDQRNPDHWSKPLHGIRYVYGDLNDVLNLLWEEPHTRQAYLPIFFPEDTGAVHRGRTPCSLGYHFMRRFDQFMMWYDIRSCDAVRHFRDDVWLAVRLQLWVLDLLVSRELRSEEPQHWIDVMPGMFYFNAHSFHVHMGDFHHLQEQWDDKMA